MIITVSISVTMVVIVVLMIINRTSIIIVTTIVITEVHIMASRHPATVYPAITATMIFPITGNPVSVEIRRQRPVALYPYILMKPVIP
jgi:hypothetical protein